MLRLLYCWLLRLHPPPFRQRFADEMLAIFDEAATKQSVVPLLFDGVGSLIRQQWVWIRGPESWEQPVAAHDVPVFYTMPSSKPSPGALLHGGVLSLLAFGAVSFAFAYGRNHPPRMSLGGFLGPLEARAMRAPSTPSIDGVDLRTFERQPETATRAPGGVWSRVLSLFSGSPFSQSKLPPVLPSTPAARQLDEWLRAFNTGDLEALRRFAAAENSARIWAEWRRRYGPLQVRNVVLSGAHEIVALAETRDGLAWRLALQLSPETPARNAEVQAVRLPPPIQLSQEQLRRYAGTYVVDSSTALSVRITVERGRLHMEITGQPGTELVAVSETRFFPVGVTNRWIEFVPDREGRFDQLNICAPGRQLPARRVVR